MKSELFADDTNIFYVGDDVKQLLKDATHKMKTSFP